MLQRRLLATCCAGVAQVWPVLRLCHQLRIDMAHFCTDLQTYIAFEVLQVGLLVAPVGRCCSRSGIAMFKSHSYA